jgi:antitoxin VapB
MFQLEHAIAAATRRATAPASPLPSIYVDVYTLSMVKDRKQRRRGRAKGVGEPPPPPYAHSPAVARVFQSGNSQAVRLPKQFRLRSKQVQVFRRGNDIVLREQAAKLSELLAALPPLTGDAFPDQIPDAPPEPIESY